MLAFDQSWNSIIGINAAQFDTWPWLVVGTDFSCYSQLLSGLCMHCFFVSSWQHLCPILYFYRGCCILISWPNTCFTLSRLFFSVCLCTCVCLHITLHYQLRWEHFSKTAIPYVYSLTILDRDHKLMGPIFTFVLLLFFAYFVFVWLVCKSYE